MLKMNLHRAQELIIPLKNGTAKGISQHWKARLIEALEYVIENESAKFPLEQDGGAYWCSKCNNWSKNNASGDCVLCNTPRQ